MHYEIQKKIIDVIDTGYTDEYGLRELVDNASLTMSTLKISKEKTVMKRFLKEVMKTEGSLAVYGEAQVRKALDLGLVDMLLLSEELRSFRVTLKCPSCGYIVERTMDEKALESFVPPKCSSCNSMEPMVIAEKKDLIDELSDKVETKGGSMQLISKESEEGDSLLRAFNGIAGILRYSVDLQ